VTDQGPAETDARLLRRGSQIPLVGFGTWQITGAAAHAAVAAALELGYRHLDTATVYGNEREVGDALADSGLARTEVFVTTKLPGNATEVRRTLERSLADLGVDFVDLWLIHWPPAQSYRPSEGSSPRLFAEMLALRDEGLARAVGVSNYGTEEIDELIATTGEAPEVNQIPWSPFRHDEAIRRDLDEREVCLEGYSPLALSSLQHPVLVAAATAHEVTPAQVVLRWHLQHGVVVLPKSARRERIAENRDLFGFTLTPTQMAGLDALAAD